MGKTYRMTLTDNQLRIIRIALEEYFRLRMGQTFDFTDDIASLYIDLSPDNPNHERIFDHMIHTRDCLREIMQCFFRVAFEPYNAPQKKTSQMMIAEDVWEAIRVHEGLCHYPLYLTEEPVVKIEEVADS